MSRREMSRFRIFRDYGDQSRKRHKDAETRKKMDELAKNINDLDSAARDGVLDNLSHI